MAKQRNRKRKPGSRRDKAEVKAAERNAPNVRVIALRNVFSFVTPTKVEGKVGTIDQDICDGIGQLHALGLLDSYNRGTHNPDELHHFVVHDKDPLELRRVAREWRDGYLQLMGATACKVARYERADKSHREIEYRLADERWDAMNNALHDCVVEEGWVRRRAKPEFGALLDLLVDPERRTNDSEPALWAKAIIDEKLLQRGRLREISNPMRFADASDWALLAAAIRGCVMLLDAKLPQRRVAA